MASQIPGDSFVYATAFSGIQQRKKSLLASNRWNSLSSPRVELAMQKTFPRYDVIMSWWIRGGEKSIACLIGDKSLSKSMKTQFFNVNWCRRVMRVMNSCGRCCDISSNISTSCLNIETVFRVWYFYYNDKTVVGPSYLQNGNPIYTC